jgi:thiamine biosynthesis protein ThiS
MSSALAISLTLNGEPRRFGALPHLRALVETLGLDPRKVAVERNLEIVPRSLYADTPIADGDRIEIVHFIGGG